MCFVCTLLFIGIYHFYVLLVLLYFNYCTLNYCPPLFIFFPADILRDFSNFRQSWSQISWAPMKSVLEKKLFGQSMTIKDNTNLGLVGEAPCFVLIGSSLRIRIRQTQRQRSSLLVDCRTSHLASRMVWNFGRVEVWCGVNQMIIPFSKASIPTSIHSSIHPVLQIILSLNG